MPPSNFLRLIVNHNAEVVDTAGALLPLKYPQSTSGLVVSHGTSPPDSRSISMANASPQGLKPQATLRKCPTLVWQRSANDSRSNEDRVLRKSLSSMAGVSPNGVISSTPNGDFTKWCGARHPVPMSSQDLKTIRIKSLQGVIDEKFGGNKSEASRALGYETTSYLNDLLAGKKSFGEKTARNIEKKLKLQSGTLDQSVGSWPFELRYLRRIEPLSPENKARIEGAIAGVLIEIELNQSQARKKTDK